MLNNRELAVTVWLAIVLAAGLRSADIRGSLVGVLGSLAHPKLLVPSLLGAGYVGLLVIGLRRVGIWAPALLKDTVFWFVFTGATTAFYLIGKWKGESILRHFAADAVKITVVIEFLTSEYTLPLPAELVLVPVLFALGGMSAVADTDPKYAAVKRLLAWVQASLGLLIVGVAVRQAVADWRSLETIATLWKFLLPLLLSLLFVPFAYVLVLYSLYDSLFARLHIGSPHDAAFRARARRRLFGAFRLSLPALHQFSTTGGRRIFAMKSDTDLNALLSRQPSGSPK